MTDLNLLYSGGSGGFLLLHLLLLSKKYNCFFQNDLALDEIIKKQWSIADHQRWKNQESWPDNLLTYQSHSKCSKIYFYCNPWVFTNGYFGNFNLVIYTDLQSQHRLAHYKRARWYYQQESPVISYNKFTEYRKLLKNWQQHYNNIKDSSWPDCKSIKKFSILPKKIQNELLENPYTEYFLNYPCQDATLTYKSMPVDESITPFLKSANLCILLQDLVNSRAEILVKHNILDHINSSQINLLNHWKSLHPPQLLTDIGIITE